MKGQNLQFLFLSPAFAGNIGTYLFKIGNITRTTSTLNLQNVDLSAGRIYPNPAKNFVSIDLTNTNTIATNINIMDIQGRIVYNKNIIKYFICKISIKKIRNYQKTLKENSIRARKKA